MTPVPVPVSVFTPAIPYVQPPMSPVQHAAFIALYVWLGLAVVLLAAWGVKAVRAR